MILRSMRLDVCTSYDEKDNVFPGGKKSRCPGSPVPYTQVWAIKSAFSSGSFRYLESGSKRF